MPACRSGPVVRRARSGSRTAGGRSGHAADTVRAASIGTAAGRSALAPRLAGATGVNSTASGTPCWPISCRRHRRGRPPPPPSPARDGSVTLSAKPRATAASAALPPADRTSRATSAARGSSATTPPRKPCTKPGWPCAGALLGPNTLSVTPETVSQAEQASVERQQDAGAQPSYSARHAARACANCLLVRVILMRERAIDAFGGSGNRARNSTAATRRR